MTIVVSVHTKHLAFGDDGELFEFVPNDPDLGQFVLDWTNNEALDYLEIWTEE